MSDQKAFYVVWCPGAGPPTYRHRFLGAAEMEARRLARDNPGKEFIVLAAIVSMVKADVSETRFEQDSGIPF